LRSLLREVFQTFILALVIFLSLRLSIQTYRAQGPSMQPTLVEGEYVMVNKFVYARVQTHLLSWLIPTIEASQGETMFPLHAPTRGEVIIFKFPEDPSRDFVKRVIGVPGDTIEVKRGTVYVNGVKLDEPYIVEPDSTDMAPMFVTPDHYFVMGDNRRASNDSRDWGLVPADLIIGRAWFVFWPLDKLISF